MGTRLMCAECGAAADVEVHGWRAFIARGPEEEDVPEVAVFCPACAEREFGESGPSSPEHTPQ